MASTTRSQKRIRNALKHSPLILVIIVSLSFVTFALAQEAGVSAEAEATTRVNTNPLVRPLDIIRARIQGGADVQMRAEVLPTAAPGERPRMQESAGAGMNANVRAQGNVNAGGLRGLVRQHAGLITQRFSLALRQFEGLVLRIESRLEKMAAQGIVTASVEAELALAKGDIATAKANVEAVADFVVNVEEGSDRAAIRAELKALIDETRASIRTAHQSLQKVVRSLVALAKDNRPQGEASASVESTTSVE